MRRGRCPCSWRTPTGSWLPRPPWTAPPPDTRLNAQRKAYTAARSDARSTRELADKVRDDPVERASFDPFFTFFLGGVAVFDGERKIGAVGVSGLPGEVDEQLAMAAIDSTASIGGSARRTADWRQFATVQRPWARSLTWR